MLGDLVIGSSGTPRGAYLDFLSDASHASYALYGSVSRYPLRTSRQCDNAVFHRDTDVGRIDAGLEIELVYDVLPLSLTTASNRGRIARNLAI